MSAGARAGARPSCQCLPGLGLSLWMITSKGPWGSRGLARSMGLSTMLLSAAVLSMRAVR